MPRRNALKLFQMGLVYSEILYLLDEYLLTMEEKILIDDMMSIDKIENIIHKLHSLKNYSEWHYPDSIFLDCNTFLLKLRGCKNSFDYFKLLTALRFNLLKNLKKLDVNWNERQY